MLLPHAIFDSWLSPGQCNKEWWLLPKKTFKFWINYSVFGCIFRGKIATTDFFTKQEVQASMNFVFKVAY